MLVELTGIWPAVGAIFGALLAVAMMLLVQRYLVPVFDYNSAVFRDQNGGWTESYSDSGSSGDHGGSSSGGGGFSSGGGGSYAGGGASGKW